MTRYLPLLLATAATLCLTSCAVNPVTGKKQVNLMSRSAEIALGKESDPAIIAQFGLYEDEALQAFIQEKGRQMADISHRSNLDYQFKVIDSDIVNAFAVPGGYVYFTRGILAHFNNEAQFAGVLGHEIGHIAARHSAQQYTKQMLAQIALMGGLVISEKFRSFAGEAMQGLQLLFLKFSRSDESESDVLGVEYSSKVGYDAHEMAGFFQTLDRMSGGQEGRLPEFLSTHPDPGRRFHRVQELADEYQAEHGSEQDYVVNREGYLKLIDGMVYGEDPRQGYVEEGVFYHPELKFQFPVPGSWRLVNTPSQVQMAPEDGEALMLFSISDTGNLAAAADAIVERHDLQNVSRQQLTVHGISGWRIVAELPRKDPYSGEASALHLETVLLDHGGSVYVFHGLCEPTSKEAYSPIFRNSMLNFRELSDMTKINVQPERIRLVRVPGQTTFSELMQAEGIPEERHEELAILNGVNINSSLAAGDLLKSLSGLW